MSKEALQLALEALENSYDYVAEEADRVEQMYGNYLPRQGKINGLRQDERKHMEAITAIKQALEQPVQEPVVFYRCNGCGHAYEQVHPTSCDCMEAGGFDRVEYYTTPPAQEFVCSTGLCHYRKPQQEPDWKAEYLKSVESGCITLDELREAFAELDATNRQVEILSDALAESRLEVAKLKEKNNG